MPRTLEQVLKARGYTDQELTDLAPMLGNAKFRSSLESELGVIDTLQAQNANLTTDLDKYDQWFTNEITPEHEKLMKEKEDAVAEAAAAKARLDLHQKLAMKRQAHQQDPAAAAEAEAEAARVAAAAADATRRVPDNKKYVDSETFQQAFESAGDAIANGVDLVMDFQELFGKRLNMTQARLEAKAARKPVRDYVEQKYNFDGRRAEIAAKAKSDEEAKIRQDERQKVMVEFGGNPNLRPMVPSNNPFVQRKKAANDKQPWELTENEKADARVQKAYQKAVERGEINA